MKSIVTSIASLFSATFKQDHPYKINPYKSVTLYFLCIGQANKKKQIHRRNLKRFNNEEFLEGLRAIDRMRSLKATDREEAFNIFCTTRGDKCNGTSLIMAAKSKGDYSVQSKMIF